MESSQPEIRIAVFDWFGVIVADLTKLVIHNFNFDSTQQQAIFAVNFLADHKYITVDEVYEIYARLMSQNSRSWTPLEVKDWLDSHAKPDFSLLHLISQAREKGMLAVVASNAASNHYDNMIRMGMKRWFDKLYVSSTIGRSKPNQDFFQYILDDHGLTPSQALFIDDSANNIQGAINAGLHAEQFSLDDTCSKESMKVILQKYNLL